MRSGIDLPLIPQHLSNQRQGELHFGVPAAGDGSFGRRHILGSGWHAEQSSQKPLETLRRTSDAETAFCHSFWPIMEILRQRMQLLEAASQNAPIKR